MNRLMLDTNILLDAVIETRPDSDEACEVLDLCNGEGDFGMACGLSLKDAYFITSKSYGEGVARDLIRTLMNLVVVAPVSAEECHMALGSDEPDFEDGIIRACAELNDADYIITRDADAYKNCPIPSVTAPEYLEIFRNEERQEMPW